MTVYEPIKCLDHGYVKLVSFMGTDATIVQAARCSIAGNEVRAVSDDRALIRYLMRHSHTTPFEATAITFEVKQPIFIARQFVRQRTQSINEMSARYGVLPEEFYVPELEHIQYQAEKNKQGRKDQVMEGAEMHRDAFADAGSDAFAGYRRRLEDGMARELARIGLPLSTYTKWWTTMNLHNLFHMLRLRLDSHAQFEARVFAEAMATIAKQLFPLAYEAFEDFKLNAITLTADDIAVLRELRQNAWIFSDDPPQWLPERFKTKRECDEFTAKIQRIFG